MQGNQPGFFNPNTHTILKPYIGDAQYSNLSVGLRMKIKLSETGGVLFYQSEGISARSCCVGEVAAALVLPLCGGGVHQLTSRQ